MKGRHPADSPGVCQTDNAWFATSIWLPLEKHTTFQERKVSGISRIAERFPA
jgi:hypothetical protein